MPAGPKNPKQPIAPKKAFQDATKAAKEARIAWKAATDAVVKGNKESEAAAEKARKAYEASFNAAKKSSNAFNDAKTDASNFAKSVMDVAKEAAAAGSSLGKMTTGMKVQWAEAGVAAEKYFKRQNTAASATMNNCLLYTSPSPRD